MTEIRFLLDLVLSHKLPPAAKKACLERIGEVEANLGQKPAYVQNITPPLAQAPSTLAAMQRHGMLPVEPAPPTAAPILPPATARIVGGEVNTGNGTRGPRKF
jgi:hypothetical protein